MEQVLLDSRPDASHCWSVVPTMFSDFFAVVQMRDAAVASADLRCTGQVCPCTDPICCQSIGLRMDEQNYRTRYQSIPAIRSIATMYNSLTMIMSLISEPSNLQWARRGRYKIAESSKLLKEINLTVDIMDIAEYGFFVVIQNDKFHGRTMDPEANDHAPRYHIPKSYLVFRKPSPDLRTKGLSRS